MHQVKGLPEAAAQRIVVARRERPFGDLADLATRAALDRGELELLASAGALPRLGRHRHQAYWRARAIEPPRPLLASSAPDDGVSLAPPAEGVDIAEDYRVLGLTLGRHPMAWLRERGEFPRCQRAEALGACPSGRFVRVAGLVTCRQRPGSASGVLFLTLEDETGNSNIVVV